MEKSDFFKNQNEVWRDSNGKIRCFGNGCPQKCDENCPIWCNTLAVDALMAEDNETAIEWFKCALELAPELTEVWTNMAAAYGNMNNHLEANKAYKTAYSFDKNHKSALVGLVVSCKNLGQFDEARKYCEELAQKHGQELADELLCKIEEAESKGIQRRESALDMTLKLLEQAYSDGIIEKVNGFPYIPEIRSEAKPTCLKIFRALFEEENKPNPYIWLAWAAYAGMGAVRHWYVDWNDLMSKGIAETLLEPRGAFAMDEYVIDIMGIGFESEEGQSFCQKILKISLWSLLTFMQDIDPSQEDAIPIVIETMQAMYYFGMILEMQRLGIK